MASVSNRLKLLWLNAVIFRRECETSEPEGGSSANVRPAFLPREEFMAPSFQQYLKEANIRIPAIINVHLPPMVLQESIDVKKCFHTPTTTEKLKLTPPVTANVSSYKNVQHSVRGDIFRQVNSDCQVSVGS